MSYKIVEFHFILWSVISRDVPQNNLWMIITQWFLIKLCGTIIKTWVIVLTSLKTIYIQLGFFVWTWTKLNENNTFSQSRKLSSSENSRVITHVWTLSGNNYYIIRSFLVMPNVNYWQLLPKIFGTLKLTAPYNILQIRKITETSRFLAVTVLSPFTSRLELELVVLNDNRKVRGDLITS